MRIIPSAQSAVASSLSNTDALTILQSAVGDAISTAMKAGLRSATVSISGKAVADIQNTMNLLKNILGYTVTISGTNFVISW